jgi:hypothetical protein
MMLNKTFLAYSELSEDFPGDVGFNRIDSNLFNMPGTYIIKETIFPGMFGAKDIFIRRVITDELFITSYTYEELTDEKRQEIIRGARTFLKGGE